MVSALASLNASAAEAENVATVLAKVREALGYRAMAAHAGGLWAEGVAESQGLRGDYELVFDPIGRFRQTIQSRRHQVVVFDGVTCWAVDWSGTPHVLQLADLEAEQTVMWIRTGRWLAEGGPFRIELLENPGDSAHVRLRLRLKQGLREMELFVHRATWLPTRATARRFGTDEVWEFDDYRSTQGLTFAHRTTHRFAGTTDTYEIRTIGASSKEAHDPRRDPFRPPLGRPHDTEFRTDRPDKFEVKQAAGGHLFVRPKVNGVDIGWFALDTGTGAGMTISPAVARRLGMSGFGKVAQGGAGKFGVGQFYEGGTFELGSIVIRGSIYAELPQPFCDAMKKIFGLELAGTCGYDLFSRAVVELDLKESTASCHEPTTYTLQNGKWQELLLNHKISCVHVTYEGNREGIFQFDTGAGSHVLFHAPEVEKLKLLEHRQTRPINVGGVGGTMDARVGQLEWFRVGDRRLESLNAIFLAPHEGALDDPYVAGTFGAGILKGAKIVFDYPHRRIAFGG
jgi:hypothetical protein